MTIIIALKDKKENCVWFASDGQGTAGDTIKDFGSKLFILKIPRIDCDKSDEEFITLNIGVSGSHFLTSYLQHSFDPPSIDTRWDFISYLYNQFFQKLQEELSLHKLLKDDDGVLNSESNLIIIYDNEIYNVYNDFSITHETEEYSCMGSGWIMGEGILHNLLTYHNTMKCEDMINEAMNTIADKNVYCNDKITIKKIPKK